MWVKKYAPQSVDDIVGNEQIVERFRAMLQSRYVQHMILAGPSGVGKSTLVQLLIERMLGRYASEGTLMFQSADERGNQTIREKVHQFVPKTLHVRTPKFVVFKQAEQLSDGAQQILRRLMEQHYHQAIFIFVCSDISSILQTIQSRCHIYKFHPVSVTAQVERLRVLGAAEKVTTACGTERPLKVLARMSHGDMRACVSYFQAACCAVATGTVEGTARALDVRTIQHVCMFPHYDQVAAVVRALAWRAASRTSGTAAEVRGDSLATCVATVRDLHRQGYCSLDIVMFFHTYLSLVGYTEDNDAVEGGANDHGIDLDTTGLRHLWLKDVALCHHRITNGVDSSVQLYGMLTSMYRHARMCTRNVTPVAP